VIINILKITDICQRALRKWNTHVSISTAQGYAHEFKALAL